MTTIDPFYRGDDHSLQVTVREKGSSDAIDISGWRFTSTLKLSSEMPDSPQLDEDGYRQVLQVTATAPGNNSDSSAGRITLTYPSAQTRQLIPTFYDFDIQCLHSDTTTTLVKGRVEVLADVTHGDSDNGD